MAPPTYTFDLDDTDKAPLTPTSDTHRRQQSRFRPRLVLLSIIAVLVILGLALGLGLGLGLGLKHRNSSGAIAPSSTLQPSPTESGGSQPTGTPGPLEAWRLDTTTEYDLDRSWDLNAAPTTRIYNLTLSEIVAGPDGIQRTVLVINGQFPGPLLRVNRGDRLIVNVTNNMSNATSMHWHGMYQNGTNWMDGTTGITQCPIPPGQSFVYDFTIENQWGTYWYHSHFSTQYTDGIVGPLIVHAPEEERMQEGYDEDQVILVQDWYHDLSTALLPGYLASGNENAEPVPDNGLIQGTNKFDCSLYDSSSGYTCYPNATHAQFAIEQNKRYRLRFINTGAFGEFQVSIDNHSLSVIEVDSTPVEPVSIQRLAIHIAQRYSVILTANQSTTSNYWLRAQMNTYCFSEDNPVLDPDVRAIFSYTNTTSAPSNSESVDWSSALDLACEDLNATLLVPSTTVVPPPASTMYVLTVSFQIGAYALDRAYINSTSWVGTPENPTLNQAVSGLQDAASDAATSALYSAAGTINPSAFAGGSQFVIGVPDSPVVDILLYSLDEGAHPFHLHGHQFWILQTGSGAFDWAAYESGALEGGNPLRRDTMTVDAYGWSLIRFVADNPGLWALHCHIAWHMEAGLLVQFMAGEEVMKGWQLPEDVLGLCAA